MARHRYARVIARGVAVHRDGGEAARPEGRMPRGNRLPPGIYQPGATRSPGRCHEQRLRRVLAPDRFCAGFLIPSVNAPVADANTISTARQRKLLGVALLAMLGIILYAGVRPLQFHPPNGARWIAGADGIRFEERGIVYSDQAFRDLVQPAADRQEAPFTIELEFESSKSAASDMAHILSDDEDDIS